MLDCGFWKLGTATLLAGQAGCVAQYVNIMICVCVHSLYTYTGDFLKINICSQAFLNYERLYTFTISVHAEEQTVGNFTQCIYM